MGITDLAWRGEGGLPRIKGEFSKQNSYRVDLLCTSLFIYTLNSFRGLLGARPREPAMLEAGRWVRPGPLPEGLPSGEGSRLRQDPGVVRTRQTEEPCSGTEREVERPNRPLRPLTEAQEREGTCPRSHSREGGPDPGAWELCETAMQTHDIQIYRHRDQKSKTRRRHGFLHH